MNAEELIRKAEMTNAERDRIEQANGMAPPSDCPLPMHLRTIDSALEAGLRMGDWDCVAEGLVMLRAAMERVN